MKIKDILSVFRNLAPEENQSGWDNCGVQITGSVSETFRVAVCLEPTPRMLEQCLDWGAGIVLTHHPLYMKPKSLGSENMFTDVVRQVMVSGAWLYAAHTSLDTRPGGPAFWLGEELGLEKTRFLEIEHARAPIEVSFYVEDSIDRETADVWANNDGMHSVSQSRTGEVRLVCDEEAWNEIAGGIEFSLGHRPLFYIRSLTAPRKDVGFGEVGTLPEPMAWDEFAARLAGLIDRDAFTLSGPQPETVSTVAYCGGSGSTLIGQAERAGADVFITGDMKYHPAVEAQICVADVGHFSLEEEMMRRFAEELDGLLDGVDVQFFKGEDPFRFHVR
ncbi:Nif3-like dinuclear metal center hexameric protein [Pseudodesulfovibrio sp.]|nr:Nif3-like dinuclear metal center hexameric protein [Pseudodesulfovibrio sp.]